jgi:hypothetical protein
MQSRRGLHQLLSDSLRTPPRPGSSGGAPKGGPIIPAASKLNHIEAMTLVARSRWRRSARPPLARQAALMVALRRAAHVAADCVIAVTVIAGALCCANLQEDAVMASIRTSEDWLTLIDERNELRLRADEVVPCVFRAEAGQKFVQIFLPFSMQTRSMSS